MRRIILCLDGTWNGTFAEKKRRDGRTVLRPTNTLKLARAVKPYAADGTEQIVYYALGVGSLSVYPGTANRLLHRVDRVLGGAFGARFEANVEDAVHFLTLNHQPATRSSSSASAAAPGRRAPSPASSSGTAASRRNRTRITCRCCSANTSA